MRVTRVVLTLLTYQHLCGKPLAYTMCLAWNMHLLIQHILHLAAKVTMTHHSSPQTPTRPVHCLPIIYLWQFIRWPGSRQHTRILRWRRRFPNSTSRWWTCWMAEIVPWKNILHTWKWLTQQCMPTPMPLWKQWHCLLYGQPRLKWYFRLWGLHDNH